MQQLPSEWNCNDKGIGSSVKCGEAKKVLLGRRKEGKRGREKATEEIGDVPLLLTYRQGIHWRVRTRMQVYLEDKTSLVWRDVSYAPRISLDPSNYL